MVLDDPCAVITGVRDVFRRYSWENEGSMVIAPIKFIDPLSYRAVGGQTFLPFHKSRLRRIKPWAVDMMVVCPTRSGESDGTREPLFTE